MCCCHKALLYKGKHCSMLLVLAKMHMISTHWPQPTDVLCALQVYRGIMRGVQDVAIKELIGTTEYQHASFRKVLRLTCTHNTPAQRSLWLARYPHWHDAYVCTYVCKDFTRHFAGTHTMVSTYTASAVAWRLYPYQHDACACSASTHLSGSCFWHPPVYMLPVAWPHLLPACVCTDNVRPCLHHHCRGLRPSCGTVAPAATVPWPHLVQVCVPACAAAENLCNTSAGG